ncbi:ATP-binding protein [Rugosimonospora africana]|uniref:Helicase HerA central domain-containing protein n=1 Tax=Rugosimonospora africana TaxID=556532 RepID=A0A8J3R3J9_9ACTN|nr:ATP-binding protein [Rugosimonospora africana]GIH21247.1 hypothetical protein Raf01_94190 [Rugosimonospora africana]
MTAWRGFQFHRLTEVPVPGPGRRDEPDDERHRQAAGALAASLIGSHADLLAAGDPGAALLIAWVRAQSGVPVDFLVGGRPFFPPAVGAPDGHRPRSVLFPPGATAVDLAPGDAAVLLDALPCWVPCLARPDSLWTPVVGKLGTATLIRGSFDRHAAHLPGPFAWLVIAAPLTVAQLKPELDRLVNEILPLSRAEIGEAKRIELERKQARYRELSRAQDGAGWRIQVLVGGGDPRTAGTAAAMLCAAAELHRLPYALEPSGRPAPFPGVRPDLANPASFTSGTELLVALTRPPERELPGLRLVEPPSFDVTPDAPTAAGLPLGSVLDEARKPVGELTLGLAALNRHTFVCGSTGAGKSVTVRHLLEQATRCGLPWLVVEPAKAEYALMSVRLAGLGAEVVVIRPGDADTPPAGLNPLAPAPGFPLQTHADLLKALFLASFQQQEPFPQILASAIKRCYEELGWDLALGEPVHPGGTPRYPCLTDLERAAEIVVGEIGYGKEVAADVRGFVNVRIGSLRLGTSGRFFEGGHPIDFEMLLRHNVVLEIEDVGDDADKAFFMGAVLLRLAEHLRVANRAAAGASPRLRHLTVIEEAHRLLRNPAPGGSGAAAHAVEMFAALLAEVRAYGEGLVIAEQIPSKLIPDVIKNTAVKIVHRLPARDDRNSVGATMNLAEDQSRYLVTLPPGHGAVFADGMDRPVLVRVPDATAREAQEPVTTAAPDALIGRRSVSCGQSCVDRACTLRRIRVAQHLLADEPWLAAWAELTVLAHLVGRETPMPRGIVRDGFLARGVPADVVDCAVSHAVDDAVAVRVGVLQPGTDSASLARHVAAGIRAVLASVDAGCGSDAQQYLATPYRWHAVRYALAADIDGSGRDPRSGEWEARFRRPILGDTRAEQFEVVSGWLAAEARDGAAREATVYGTRRPSTVERLIGAGPGEPQRIRSVLDQFDDCAWAMSLLGVDPSGG